MVYYLYFSVICHHRYWPLPIPGELVKRIEAKNYINMGELHPEHLETPSIHTEDDEHRGPKPKDRPVTTILE